MQGSKPQTRPGLVDQRWAELILDFNLLAIRSKYDFQTRDSLDFCNRLEPKARRRGKYSNVEVWGRVNPSPVYWGKWFSSWGSTRWRLIASADSDQLLNHYTHH